MPKVPTLQENRIQEQGLNVSRVSTQVPDQSAFGGGVAAKQLSGAAAALAKQSLQIQQEERQKADQIAIIEADQKLSALETSMLYDKENGAMSKLGKDSFQLPDTVIPDFKKQAAEIEKGLTNDFQKISFRKMMANRQKHIDRQIQRHVSREAKKYDDQVTASYLENERNAAIEGFFDPDRVQLSIDRQRGAILSHADRNGLPQETVKQKIEEMQSQTHSVIVNKILNGGADQEAQAYYKKNKDLIVGEDRVRVEKMLKEGIFNGDAQRRTDSIVAKHDDMNEALDKARSIGDAKKRDEVVRRVKSRFSEMRLAKKEAEDQAFDVAYKAVEGNKTLDAVPKEVLSNLSLSRKRALEKRAAQLRNGLAVESDIAVKYELETMAGNPATRQKFQRMNLLDIKHKLSESDFDRFAKLQSQSRAGKATKELDGIETKNSIVKNALAAGGVEVGRNAGQDDLKKANLFRRKVDELVVQEQESTGKKISNERLRQITENLMTETIVDKGFFFDTRKKVFELTAEDQPLIKLEDVPAGELEKISNALRRMNVPVTEENQLKLYTEKLNRLRGGNG